MLPFLRPVSKWHFTHKEYNGQYPETYLDEIQEWVEYPSTKYVICRFDNHSIAIDVFKIWASPGERYTVYTVAWLDHLLLVRTSVTINKVYSLKCLLEFASFTTFAPYSSKGTEWNFRFLWRHKCAGSGSVCFIVFLSRFASVMCVFILQDKFSSVRA